MAHLGLCYTTVAQETKTQWKVMVCGIGFLLWASKEGGHKQSAIRDSF